MTFGRRLIAGIAALGLLSACQSGIPREALELSPEALKNRQMETRRFDTLDEPKLLAASAGVLQDLGFTIENSETEVGLIVATKDRDATEAGQVASAMAMAILFRVSMPVDRNQKFRVSLVTRPIPESDSTSVRITFQRIVWNNRNQISRSEGLYDPELYQEFFDQLSQSVFLTANEI